MLHPHAFLFGKVFRKTLRYYSLNSGGSAKHGGVVSASGVESSLNSFGLYPEKREIEGACSGSLSEAVVGAPRWKKGIIAQTAAWPSSQARRLVYRSLGIVE